MVSSFSLCNGMCKSKCIHCVVFLFLEFHEDLHTAFSVLYRPAHLCEIHLSAPLPLQEHPPALGVNSLFPLVLVILELSTDSSARLLYHEKNVCDLAILPQFYKQVLASPTKKIKEGKSALKNIYISIF